jgi:hypothetical protein
MARATESPNEAAIARRLLAELDKAEPRQRQRWEYVADEMLSGRMRWSHSIFGSTLTVSSSWDTFGQDFTDMMAEWRRVRGRQRIESSKPALPSPRSDR